MTEVKAPVFPESVADGTVAVWHKSAGDQVKIDELIAEIETDKVVMEVIAPVSGVLKSIAKPEGELVLSGEVIGVLEEGAIVGTLNQENNTTTSTENEQAGAHSQAQATPATPEKVADIKPDMSLSPAVRKMAAESGVNATNIEGSGKGGRVTKEDMVHALQNPEAQEEKAVTPSTPAPTEDTSVKTESGVALSQAVGERVEKRVPMTRLRKRVAERLLAATQETAMLTTFNEVNMKPIMDMRKEYQSRFEDRHGVRLGFMSFFVKACTEALKRFPAVNASIDANDVVYHGFYDIGVAVSSDRGLVVPVLRDTDRMNLAEVEKKIIEYGGKAKQGKLSLDEMTGGTFTISNGGVFGSLMSTPILNPPQTAILGMHTIKKRPMAVGDEVVILPMMYLALSYDHRLIDGKEAVQFLVTIKELVEDPALLLLDL